MWIFGKSMVKIMNPELSIVVPIYNGKKYIKPLVESIRNSIFSDWELLLINDGSTDDTLQYIEKLAQADRRIIVFNKTNGGIADTRNYGLEKARGSKVCFMDQDDFIGENGLASMVNLINKKNVDFVSSNMYYFNNKKSMAIKKIFITSSQICNKSECKDLCKFLIGQNFIKQTTPIIRKNKIPGAVWACMFKTKFLKENNISFEKFVDYEDDLVFLVKCLVRANSVYLSSNSYYYWRTGHVSEHRRLKYISDFYKRRQSYRAFLINTLNQICNSKSDYKAFIEHFNEYTLWKDFENQLIHDHLKYIRENLFNVVDENHLNSNMPIWFKGYKKIIVKSLINYHLLGPYIICYMKLKIINLLNSNG